MLKYFLFVGLIHITLGGQNDTLEQLKAAISNVPLDDQVSRAPVSTVSGSVPDWLSGTLIRHACGVLGETSHPDPDMLNRVTHLFDCISMGQSYSIHEGNVVFTSKYYDTNQVDIWERYEENMNQSSVWWGTVYAEQNLTAKGAESSNMNKPGKPGMVPNVAWWQLDNDVLATTESDGGYIVDVHNVIAIKNYPYTNGDWLGDGYRGLTNPSHEAYGPDGVVWSTVAAIKFEEGKPGKSKRLVYKVDPEKKERVVIGEYQYGDVDFSLCSDPGVRYPDPEARVGQVHSLQTTEKYVIIAENSYRYDPCSAIMGDESLPHYTRHYSYESKVNGTVFILAKDTDEYNESMVMVSISVPPMFITHVLGSYEEKDLIHFDVLQYDNASPYTTWSNTEVIANGTKHPEDFSQVKRYTIDTNSWTLKEIKDIIEDDTVLSLDFEFSNINPAYYARPYKYAYMTKNVFNLNGAVVKLNVDDGSLITKELPDGWFPTEPIFVPSPDSKAEDDGLVLMSGVDGEQEKGFIIIYNATNMEVVYQGRAPGKTLIGLHSKFFPFNVGCSQDDCTHS